MRIAGRALVAAFIIAAPGASLLAEDDPAAALAGLSAQALVERRVVERERARLREAAADHLEAERSLEDRMALVDPVKVGDAGAQGAARIQGEAVDRALRDVGLARAASEESFARWRLAAEALRAGLERLSLIETRIAEMRAEFPEEEAPLTGTWDVAFLPSGDRGVFTLKQTGTIVVGQYSLQGGWKGSLQGTFVGGKIYLQRIDSKLGRSQELEGFLEPGGRLVRGSWQNYSLAEGAAASGSWTATPRRD